MKLEPSISVRIAGLVLAGAVCLGLVFGDSASARGDGTKPDKGPKTPLTPKSPKGPNPFMLTLGSVSSVERPTKAADLVAHADADNVRETTVNVVKAALGLNPASAALVVAEIAKKTPAMAALAAATAAALLPKQSAAIARAAALAAPGQAGDIVEAVCLVVPADYRKVAGLVAEALPGSGREILAGVGAALPQLQDYINQVLAGSAAGFLPSVNDVLTQVAKVSFGTASITSASVGGAPGGASGGGTSQISISPTVLSPGPRLDPNSSGPGPASGQGYISP